MPETEHEGGGPKRAPTKDEGERRFGHTTGAVGEQPPVRQLHRGPEGPIISDAEKPQPVGEQSLEFGSGKVRPTRMGHDPEHKSGSTDIVDEQHKSGSTV